MAAISSIGLGSGLDVNSIISQLEAIERQPITLLTQQTDALNTKLSSFGLLQSYATNIDDASAILAKPATWTAATATSSDSTAVTASTSAGVTKGSYAIEVGKLAQAQTLASKTYATSDTVLGSGKLTITLGSWSSATPPVFTTKNAALPVDVTIAPGKTSLSQIRDQINAANAGVTASIVKDANGARLSIRSAATGAENAVKITATPDPSTDPAVPTLADLAYDPGAGTPAMTLTQAAQNAEATINGLPIVSTSNTLDNNVAGLTLTLTKVTAAGSPVMITAAPDTVAMNKAVNDFIKSYNDLNKYITDQTAYDPDKKVAAALQGDSSTLSLQRQLRSAVVGSSGASSVFSHLSDLGIRIQKDGSLQLDNAKFSDALAKSPDEVMKAFTNVDATQPSNNGFAVNLRALTDKLTDTGGLIDQHSQGLRDSIARNQKQNDVYEQRVADWKARTQKMYSDLDTKMGTLTALNTYVSQQIAQWNK